MLQTEAMCEPSDSDSLWTLLHELTGFKIAREEVCRSHTAPWRMFCEIRDQRPALALVHGPRGGGKSLLSALDTHLTSRLHPDHATRILGGSKSQSEQIYRALRMAVDHAERLGQPEGASVVELLKDRALYQNGSEVEILAASSTSVRGPHVASLKLDEVDEIDTDIREAAMGMCMNQHGVPASVLMTSTWHRINGPMAGLLETVKESNLPLYHFCVFEVLERCPESRSGANLEKCPLCPLMKWCHDDRDCHPRGLPKAKRSDGHYDIDSLTQKIRATGRRAFEADYLCLGPRSEGLWFASFDAEIHVSTRAEYDPALPVHLAIDSGVFTGAVFFQVAPCSADLGKTEEARVFADYLSEGKGAEQNARAIFELARTSCNGRLNYISTDQSGGARNPIGPTVISEYERIGLRPLHRWPKGPPADGLAMIESFVQPADGLPRLSIHPRCVSLIQAMQNYRRAKWGGQWQDEPADPQHPFEDLIDAFRGGLRVYYPNGRCPESSLPRISARRVF